MRSVTTDDLHLLSQTAVQLSYISYLDERLLSNMSPWIFVFYLVLHHISFLSADGVFTDELTLFNDPLQSTYLLDITNSEFVSDANFIFEGSGGLDTLPNDPGLDLVASDADLNSIVDSPFLADCTSSDNSYFLKKTRVRRETECRNPYPNPSLSLPTLDQISASEANKGPFRPRSPRAKKIADILNEIAVQGGLILKTSDLILKDCRSGETRACSSDNGYEVQLEGNRETYALSGSTACKWLHA